MPDEGRSRCPGVPFCVVAVGGIHAEKRGRGRFFINDVGEADGASIAKKLP
jgi:hypothetical protein